MKAYVYIQLKCIVFTFSSPQMCLERFYSISECCQSQFHDYWYTYVYIVYVDRLEYARTPNVIWVLAVAIATAPPLSSFSLCIIFKDNIFTSSHTFRLRHSSSIFTWYPFDAISKAVQMVRFIFEPLHFQLKRRMEIQSERIPPMSSFHWLYQSKHVINDIFASRACKMEENKTGHSLSGFALQSEKLFQKCKQKIYAYLHCIR